VSPTGRTLGWGKYFHFRYVEILPASVKTGSHQVFLECYPRGDTFIHLSFILSPKTVIISSPVSSKHDPFRIFRVSRFMFVIYRSQIVSRGVFRVHSVSLGSCLLFWVCFVTHLSVPLCMGCVFYCHLKTYCGSSSETMQSPEYILDAKTFRRQGP
jgi:hypothetical protein